MDKKLLEKNCVTIPPYHKEWVCNLVILMVTVSIIGVNIGYTDYLSIPFISLLCMLTLTRPIEGTDYLSDFYRKMIVGALVSIFPVTYFLIWDVDFHTALSHSREYVMFVIILWFYYAKFNFHKQVAEGYVIACTIVAILTIFQRIQISISAVPLVIPKEWLMLEYGNSLQNAIEGEWALRPVAFFSEPSVISAILVPVVYYSLRSGKVLYALFFSLAVFASDSMYGMLAIICIFIVFLKNAKLFFPILIFSFFMSAIVISSSRFEQLSEFGDMSFDWRFLYPFELLHERIVHAYWFPISIDQITSFQKYYYENSSITDTWFLFILVKLGFLSVPWIIYIFWAIPTPIKLYFVYLCFLSGAPLYHDRTLLCIYNLLILKWITEYESHSSCDVRINYFNEMLNSKTD